MGQLMEESVGGGSMLWQNGTIMATSRQSPRYAAGRVIAAVAAVVLVAAPEVATHSSLIAQAQAFSTSQDGVEMEQALFVQAPDFANGGDSIVLVWLPDPLESTCVGRTMRECARIDYCVRTTNPDSAQCRNLGIRRADMPHYPAGMRPRRMISVTMRKLTNDHGFDRLKEFYRSAPASSLSRLSMDARIRARIRYDDNPSFEGFTLLEVLDAPAR